MAKFKIRIFVFVTCAVIVLVTVGVYQQVALKSIDSVIRANRLQILWGHSQNDKGRRGGKQRDTVGSNGIDVSAGKVHSQYSDGAEDVIMYDEAVERLLNSLDEVDDSSSVSSYPSLRKMSFVNLVYTLGLTARKDAPGFSGYRRKYGGGNISTCLQFHMGVRKHALYDPDGEAIDNILHDTSTGEIVRVEMMDKGTELKLLITLDNGCTAVLKPMRWGRDYETLANHFYFNYYERHNSEIAAFHLDRLLGFYRVPPVTGRLVNITSELFRLAEKPFRKTFYISPAGNLCFYGNCMYYCDSRHAFCGDGEMIEVSLMAYLPPETVAKRQRWKSPYRRSYSKFRRAEWEENSTYCDGVKQKSPYSSGRFLLDIVDMHIFDFLTGNMDRHHVEIFREFGNYSFLIHLDNGRGFGKKSVDEFSILAPLAQCCIVRESTFLKLAKLYIGPWRLGELLDESLKSDPVYPVLAKGHLHALDRRVIHVLRTIAKCVDKTKGYDKVIIKDPF